MATANEAKHETANLAQAAPLLEEIERIDQRLPEIARELLEVGRGFLPKDEITQRLLDGLKALRSEYQTPSSWVPDVHGLISTLSAEPPPPLRVRDGDHALKLITWLLWPVIETSAPHAVAGVSYEAGLGSKQRRDGRARLETERVALVEKREDLVERVNALGAGRLRIDHLPQTAERLDQERRTREAREERLIALKDNMAKHGRYMNQSTREYHETQIRELEALLGVAPQESRS